MSAEVAGLRRELRSIERLIEDLLQQQRELCLWLTCLKPAGSQRALALNAVAAPADVPCLTSPGSQSWASVVKVRKRLSLPLYHPSSIGGDFIPVSNFFSPLAELPCPFSYSTSCLHCGPCLFCHRKTFHSSQFHLVLGFDVPFIASCTMNLSL